MAVSDLMVGLFEKKEDLFESANKLKVGTSIALRH